MFCIPGSAWHFSLENWKEKLRSFLEEMSSPAAIFSVAVRCVGCAVMQGTLISEEFLSSLKEG